ncbi:hypothetical protein AAG570_006036 [Ranatra chinensis]|uniref:Dolichyl-diphosphooligosaccharide--protein glycosyltransferase subunit 2 n=1 Tax=Ranatra chinensis TaxID=642074 RepID=A0ABD0XWV2_9HEMI
MQISCVSFVYFIWSFFVLQALTDLVEKEGTAPSRSASEVYYAVSTLKNLNAGFPTPKQSEKLVKLLQAALKKDDSISNLGYCLSIAAAMGPSGSFAFDRIEDAIVQADEVDGKYLQFEGGLSITALVISGTYNLATSLNRAPPLTGEQVVKFSNYFLSRRSVQTPKGAYSLLNIFNILTNNKFHTPVVISVVGGGTGGVSVDNPRLNVRVTNLLGENLPPPHQPLSVTVESATSQSNSVVVVSKKKFEQSTTDKSVYSVGLLESKPEPGVYKVAVNVVPAGASGQPSLVGNVAVPLTVRVMATVVPHAVQIGTGDADQTTQPKFYAVNYPSKLEQTLEVDSLQKLVIRFSLKDKSSEKSVGVHQAFVRLSHERTQQELIFVTETDSSNNYRLDLDIGAKANDLGQLSGLYRVELIIGDVILSNSLSWHLADVKIKLMYDSPTGAAGSADTHPMYRPKPEIKLGVNISNFPFSLSSIGFHIGLGGIFVLFGMFWLKLNMFETLKYLLGLGIVTFLCGNKMLAKIASQRAKH